MKPCCHRLGSAESGDGVLRTVTPVRCKCVTAEPERAEGGRRRQHPPPHLQQRADSSVHHAVQAAGRTQQVQRSTKLEQKWPCAVGMKPRSSEHASDPSVLGQQLRLVCTAECKGQEVKPVRQTVII